MLHRWNTLYMCWRTAMILPRVRSTTSTWVISILGQGTSKKVNVHFSGSPWNKLFLTLKAIVEHYSFLQPLEKCSYKLFLSISPSLPCLLHPSFPAYKSFLTTYYVPTTIPGTLKVPLLMS